MTHPYRRIAGMLLLALLLAVVFFAGVAVGITMASASSSAPDAVRVHPGQNGAPSHGVKDGSGSDAAGVTVRDGAPPSPTAAAQPTAPAASVSGTLVGIAGTYGPGYDGWLALPAGPGIRVVICGVGGCVGRVSNDAGPSLAMQRRGRIVDLDVATFELACGVPWTRGLCRVTVDVLP